MFKKPRPRHSHARRRRPLLALSAVAAAGIMGLLIAKNCNSDKINQEPQDPRPAIVQTEPNPRPVPILIPQENIERQREMDSEPQERQENQEETPRNALEAVRAEFSEESITCQRTSLTLPFSRRAFIMHFDHNSRALSNPLTGPSSIQAPTEIFGMIEEEENNENLLAILRHLDSIGIAQQEGRSWGSRVHRYLFEMNERQPGPFFDEECVARTGNALLAASRVITILIERAIGDGQGFGELADSMPPNLQEIFYDRLSIALFENNERFDARFTERALREFSTEQKWDFFERLFDFVFMSTNSENSYRSTAREVRRVSNDRITRRGIDSIFEEVERREQNPLGDW